MTLTVAIQMDPIGSIDIIGDTSFALGLEAQERGHHLWYYTPDSLSLNAGRVEATGQSLKLRDVAGDHFDVGNREVRALSDFDVILMRQDPPFDMNYITAVGDDAFHRHVGVRQPPQPLRGPAQRTGDGSVPSKQRGQRVPDLRPGSLCTALHCIHALPS